MTMYITHWLLPYQLIKMNLIIWKHVYYIAVDVYTVAADDDDDGGVNDDDGDDYIH